MNYEHLADSWIQGYIVHKIRLRSLGRSNIEISLLENEFLDKLVQKLPYYDDSSIVNKVYHHFINHSSL
jgi:hypothetical protein